MALYVYTDINKKLSCQPEQFRGTKINTCNSLSEVGKLLSISMCRMYFETTAESLYHSNEIKGTMHYGGLVTFECTFPDLASFIFFFKNVSKPNPFFPKRIF